MNRYIFIFLILVNFTLQASPERDLAWVETANVKNIFNSDISSNNLRFFEICGFSCWPPGVGQINALKCYSIKIERINGTSDAISDQHKHLNDIARNFATEYNKLMANYLKLNNLSYCDSTADWDTAWQELLNFIETLSKKGNAGSVNVPLDPREPDFNLVLPSIDQLELYKSKFCQIIVNQGIHETVTLGLCLSGTNCPRKISCTNGQVGT